jgi:hypothetical protein
MALAARAHAGSPPFPRWLVNLRWTLRSVGWLLLAAALFVTPELLADAKPGHEPLTDIGVASLVAYRVLSVLGGAVLLALAELLPTLAQEPEQLLGPLCGLVPLGILSACVALKLALGAEHPSYTGLAGEDGLVEYATSAAYLGASWVAALVARGLWRRNQRGLASLWSGLAVLLVLAGLEEISWGQRLFSVQTPELFASNVQHEMNLHNLPWAQRSLHAAYVAVGLFGALAWALVPRRAPAAWRELAGWLVPSAALFSFFLPVALFYLVWDYTPRSWIGPGSLRLGFVSAFDQEPAELLLSLGFLAFALHAWARLHGWVRESARQSGSASAPGRLRINPR